MLPTPQRRVSRLKRVAQSATRRLTPKLRSGQTASLEQSERWRWRWRHHGERRHGETVAMGQVHVKQNSALQRDCPCRVVALQTEHEVNGLYEIDPARFCGIDRRRSTKLPSFRSARHFSRAINQDKTVTQSEIDFAQRILGKTIPESITPTGYGNIAQGVGELADSVGSGLGSFQWKVYAPIFVLGIVVIGVLLAFNKAKSAN